MESNMIYLVDESGGDIDLYEVLGISSSATKTEIKKAYHKAALSSHPDKVPEEERVEAEIRFKSVSKAYEILYDEDKRHLYDTHGMAAFDPGSQGPGGMGPEVDLDDIFQMFGMGGGMPHGFAAGGGRPRKPARGRDEEQIYDVTLEELYRGKTTKFASTKNVICSICKGSGGKDKAKPKDCATCHGRGFTQGLRSVGPGLVTQETVECGSCKGTGKIFKEKDRCKKCKGNRTVEERKVLEIYIPRGSRQGDRIILEGEADQVPDQEPGDIVFILQEKGHPTFTRAGSDLSADFHVSLIEALTGFSRVVVKHLDGRGIHINQPSNRVLRPGQVLKVPGEGMYHKKTDERGDLYLQVQIDFPPDGWLNNDVAREKLRDLLPKPSTSLTADLVDEVDHVDDADMAEFGADSDDPRGGSQWVDDDEDEHQGPQCAQQ